LKAWEDGVGKTRTRGLFTRVAVLVASMMMTPRVAGEKSLSGGIGGHDMYFAWGHGGQFVSIAPELELVVVTTAYNFVGDFSDNSWNTEGRSCA
jgi:hypothetical protein